MCHRRSHRNHYIYCVYLCLYTLLKFWQLFFISNNFLHIVLFTVIFHKHSLNCFWMVYYFTNRRNKNKLVVLLWYVITLPQTRAWLVKVKVKNAGAYFTKTDLLNQQFLMALELIPINTLWPSDAIWWDRYESTLAQVMACCLTAPNHYLSQCWLLISKIMWHSPDSNVTGNAAATICRMSLKIILYNYFHFCQGPMRQYLLVARPLGFT